MNFSISGFVVESMKDFEVVRRLTKLGLYE